MSEEVNKVFEEKKLQNISKEIRLLIQICFSKYSDINKY